MSGRVITLNGKRFAHGSRGLVSSLFNPSGTADGYWRKSGRGVAFHAPDGRHIATINADGVMGRATKLEDGRTWYSYGDPDIIGRNPSYSAEREECRAALAIAREA